MQLCPGYLEFWMYRLFVHITSVIVYFQYEIHDAVDNLVKCTAIAEVDICVETLVFNL